LDRTGTIEIAARKLYIGIISNHILFKLYFQNNKLFAYCQKMILDKKPHLKRSF
jgi:hypothetical protein